MKLNDCGCCEDEVQEGVHNDPGLSEITVRIADFGGFKRGMHEALGRQPALGKLTTRDDADPALALVDAWATALDVLTFYNDRIANESYLRTAVEPRSMREFAREIGYLPAPATAALADLAFTVSPSVESVRIDAGTKVQSQPGQDELPQIYETLETITGYPGFNATPVRQVAPDRLSSNRTSASFVGTTFDVKVGDTLLFVTSGTTADPSKNLNALAKVTSVTRNDKAGTTRLQWSPALPSSMSTADAEGPQVLIIRQKAAMFGFNAIDFANLPVALRIGERNPNDNTFVASAISGQSGSWANAAPASATLDLDAIYPSISTGSWLVVQIPTGSSVYRVDGVSEAVVSKFLISAKVTRVKLDRATGADANPKNSVLLAANENLTLADRFIQEPIFGDHVELSKEIEFEKGRNLLIVGKRIRLSFPLELDILGSDGETLAKLPANESVKLEAFPTFTNVFDASWIVTRDDGTRGVVRPGQASLTLLPAREDDPADQGERIVVKDGTELTSSLKYVYDRASTVVYGNVARASHGETKREVIGSGNAAVAFQKFTLSNAPLTYLVAPTETGVQSTLELRVEDVLWHETLTLLDQGARDRTYTVRPNETGKTEVTFGNGVHGARPATGVENIAAKYRVGAGLKGRVRKGQLNMLLTRPLGVTDAVNPVAATGGSDAEGPDDIGKNIPRSVLTLGRVVSLSDFSDAALRLPGVAKAQATLLWKIDQRIVFLTVAGPDGSPADVAAVSASLDVQRDTHQTVVVMLAERIRFRTRVEIIVREDTISEGVLNEVRKALLTAFGFEARQFAEAVTVSEIDAAVHTVPGVRAANVTVLDFTTGTGKNDVLRIKPARYDAGALKPAQILLIDPLGIELSEAPIDL